MNYNLEMVEELIQGGTDVNYVNNYGNCALM